MTDKGQHTVSPDRSGKPRTTGRLWLFRAIAMALPFVALLVLEGLLRLFGYGHELGLLVPDPQHDGYLVLNPHASKRYFSETANATVGNAEPFRRQKADGTVRIFVLGESTTIGYPYFHNGSFHRWLQYRLLHTYPDRNFEIINLAMTAVNSWTVYDFGRELIDYQPDAVLVYAGHNEYYGALGVGSTSSLARAAWLVRGVIQLRNLRLVQALTNAVAAIRSGLGGPVDTRENLMKRMAAKQQIAYESADYQQGIEQFKINLTDLCRVFSNHNIPVFLSNLVSNEKDLSPFISASGNGAASATAQYQMAKAAYAAGDFRRAKAGFIQARELDLLRFRAPEAMNSLIRELAAGSPNVTLVDTKKVFERQSPAGILGRETLLEHVHPTLYGYALLSDAFYTALIHRTLWPDEPQREMTWSALRQQMPITLVDSLAGAYEVSILKEGWPFNQPMPAPESRPKTAEEQLAGALVVKQITWPDAMNRLLMHYTDRNDGANALTVAEALTLEYPLNAPLHEQAAKLSLSQNHQSRAVAYLKRAFRLEAKTSTAQALFINLLKADQPDEALPYLRYAATSSGNPPSLTQLASFVEQIAGLKKELVSDTGNVQISNQLAAGYLQFANATAARKYVDKTLKIDPNNAEARQLLSQIRTLTPKQTTP